MHKLILKVTWKCKRSRIPKTYLKKNKVKELPKPEFSLL